MCSFALIICNTVNRNTVGFCKPETRHFIFSFLNIELKPHTTIKVYELVRLYDKSQGSRKSSDNN